MKASDEIEIKFCNFWLSGTPFEDVTVQVRSPIARYTVPEIESSCDNIISSVTFGEEEIESFIATSTANEIE